MRQKRVYLRGLRGWIAAALLMFMFGIFGGKPELPELHSESSQPVPTVTLPRSASGNVTPGMITYTSKPKLQS